MSTVTDQIPDSLRPYFEVCFIFGFGICDGCSREEPFVSHHPQFSDGWWLDEAKAMKDAGWVIPKEQVAYCPQCASQRGCK
jgi:hypothetical protein